MTDSTNQRTQDQPEPVHPEVLDEVAPASGEASSETTLARTEEVTKPTKLIRIASMVRSLLDEVRRAPLDEQGRKRLREIHEAVVIELNEILSDDLKDELTELATPFGAETPSESELRIAQAQLVGWLEGLFHGIQATLFTQQMQAKQAFEEMRGGAALEGTPRGRPPGAYL